MTFVGAISLAEEGVLDLDVPINRWLSDRAWLSRISDHESITLRHLLTHRLGLLNHVYKEEFAAEASRQWSGQDGGLVSTSGDLARWGVSLFGGRLLPVAALELLLVSEPIDPATPDIQYGMGVAIYRDSPSGPVYRHGGWIPGYTSSLRYYKDYGVAIAFQINTDIGIMDDTSSVVQTIESKLAEVVLSIKEQDR